MRFALPLGCIALAAVVGCQNVEARFQRSESRTLTLKAGGQVDLSNFRGPVRVDPWDRDEVQVEAQIREVKPNTVTLVASAQEGLATIRLLDASEDAPFSFSRLSAMGNSRAEVVLHVPRSVRLNLTTRHGSVDVHDLKGTLEIHSTHGAVTLNSHQGQVSVETTHGSIGIRGIQGRAEVATTHGDISAEDISEDLRAATTHARIEARKVGGRADLTTTHATVLVEGVQGNTQVRTTHGRVEAIRIQGDLDVTSSHGSLRLEEIQGGVEAETSFGTIEARRLANSNRPIRLRTSHASIQLDAAGLEGTLRAPLSRLDLPRTLSAHTQDGDEATVQLGKATRPIELDTTHARIQIQQ